MGIFSKWSFRKKRSELGPGSRQECPTGIKVWFDPIDPIVDIVFIHGLNGHREATWRHASASKPWPQTLLPETISNARIMSYGYDANVVNWTEFLGKVSKNGIKQHAQNLLETLASRRSDPKSHSRDIIFVCHSLGGIVCKDALVTSSERALEPHLYIISKCTHAVLFLGTPHKGVELAQWASRLAQLVGVIKQTHTEIVAQLKKDSEELDRIQGNFDNLLRCRSINQLPEIYVKCFFEEKSITGIGRVVDYNSAILAGNTPVGINKDHREMTRFRDKDEHGYALVEFTLRRWIETLSNQVNRALPNRSQALNTPTSPLELPSTPPPREMASPLIQKDLSPSELSSSSSSSSSFVKIPPDGRFIVNTTVVKLPRRFFPPGVVGKESRYYQPQKKELEQIHSIMFPPKANLDHTSSSRHDRHRSFLITGLGGTGKSELAYRFAMNYQNHFDMIFFLIADTESRLFGQYSTIASELGLVEPSEIINQEHCSAVLRTWLGDPVKGAPENEESKELVKWLLVFDNAEDADVIEKFWPTGQYGSILLTSRNPLLDTHALSIKGKVQLHGLPLDDGARLLHVCAQEDQTPNPIIKANAKTIVDWVQGIPMAIQQLGSLIYNDNLSISGFLDVYPTKNDLFGRLHEVHSKDKNLITVWALDALQERHSDAYSLLAIIAMLDPETIEDSLLVPRQTSLNADGSSMKRPNYIGYRKHLATTSLIDVDRDSQSVRVHRVVQNVMIEMLLRDGTSASFFKEAILRVADQWPFLNRNYVTGSATKVDRWVQCGRVYHHLLRLKEVYVQLNKLQVSHLAAFDIAELLLEAAQYRLECGIGHEAIPLLELAEVIYGLDQSNSPCLEEERGKVYRARIGLAVSSKNTEDLLNYAQLGWEVEEKRHRKIGHPTSILAVAYNDLAVAWACYGEWERGIELLKKSTFVREHLPGFTRDKLFSPLYHLGLILQHQAKYDEAENILNGAIKDREEFLGTSEASISVRSAALYYARGNVRFSRADPLRKDIEKSLLDHMEAVSRCRQSVGSRNRTTLICKYQVAKVSAELRNFKKSCELLDEILCNTIEAVTYYPDIARTAYLYAHCLDALGNTTESNRWLLKSLDVHNKLRSQHIRTTGTLTKDDITGLIPYDYL